MTVLKCEACLIAFPQPEELLLEYRHELKTVRIRDRGSPSGAGPLLPPGDLIAYSEHRDRIAAPDTTSAEAIAYVDRGTNMFGGVGSALYAQDPCDNERCGNVLWELADQDEDYHTRLRPCGLIVEPDEDGIIEDDREFLAAVFLYGYIRLFADMYGEDYFEGAQLGSVYHHGALASSFENALIGSHRFELAGSWKGHVLVVNPV